MMEYLVKYLRYIRVYWFCNFHVFVDKKKNPEHHQSIKSKCYV